MQTPVLSHIEQERHERVTFDVLFGEGGGFLPLHFLSKVHRWAGVKNVSKHYKWNHFLSIGHSSLCVGANPRPFLFPKDLLGFRGEISVIPKISGRIQFHSHVWKRFPRLIISWVRVALSNAGRALESSLTCANPRALAAFRSGVFSAVGFS